MYFYEVDMVSLITDSRVVFLLWFISIAIIVAGVLVFIEIRLKKRKEKEGEQIIEGTTIEKMQRFLKEENDIKTKLDFVNKSAKEYFRQRYGLSMGTSYSRLIEIFKKSNKKKEVDFCESMFEAYYSYKNLTNQDVLDLGELLVDIERIDMGRGEFVGNLDAKDKIQDFFSSAKKIVVQKNEKPKDNIEKLKLDIKKQQSLEVKERRVLSNLDEMEKRKLSLIAERNKTLEEAKKAKAMVERDVIVDEDIKKGNVLPKIIPVSDSHGFAQKTVMKEKARIEKEIYS